MTRRQGDGFIGTYGTCIALVVLFVAFAASAPNFLASANLLNILRQASFLAILATGFTLALVVAELDLSFANACSLAAVCMGALLDRGMAPWIAVAAPLAVVLERARLDDRAHAFGRADHRATLGELRREFRIGLVLVAQAAHEPSAST